MTQSEALARATTCEHFANAVHDPAQQAALLHMRRLWLNLAREGLNPDDLSAQFEELLELQAQLFRHPLMAGARLH